MNNDRNSPARIVLPLLLFALLITVYSFTLLPGVGYSGDTAKWQFVGHVLGTPHTTGYPTYIFLNHLFTKYFPFGSIAYRANLLSAIFGAAACVVIYYLLRLLNVSRQISFFSALTFGVTLTFWSQALVAEVYTLNLLFVSLVFYLFLKWRMARRRLDLIAACGVYAISFGNHLTMVTLFPAVVYLVWTTDRKVFLDRKIVIPVALLILAGVLQYSYLIWRFYTPNPAYLELQTPNIKRFWISVSGAGFKRKMFVYSLPELIRDRIPMYAQLLLQQFYILIPFVIYGFFKMRDRVLNRFLLLAFAGSWIYAIDYDIQDISMYFIPGYFILMIYIAVACNEIPFFRKSYGAVALALIPAILVVFNYNEVDQSKNTREALESKKIFELLQNNSVIITNYRFSQYFWYYLLEENPEKKQIYILRVLSPENIQEYLAGKTEFTIREMKKKVPFGSRIYCMTDPFKKELTENGFSLTEIRRNLYLVSKKGAIARSQGFPASRDLLR